MPRTSLPTMPITPAEPADWVAPHRVAVWRYLRALGAGAEEADDLAQEAMLIGCSATQPAPELTGPFLRGVARNLWLRSRRWWRRRRERVIATAVEELWLATADRDAGDELLDRLRHCVQLLPPRARRALELHYRDELGWNEIAAQLGLRPNGTKTLAQRARGSLRECIERRQA
ncbi:MAG: sigma-70 family RNA polymerase sigma factor [Planctomycetes bacterium]|nr:sigma-70 family RNA polymerase sigma factor [Planctomycetota bacterium]